ncbi:hypothetical protein Clacol_007147 [Clathrus columnatus]|uniref:Potassium transporter n=1 Tax=Clathrus columnatus TaxID=1419009 RepID=A0AAV5AE46_9AGAM|nr:hypothetical protein Clacol_007147 [Clathrus columnatus]
MEKTVDIEVLRRPVKFSGLSLLALSFQTLGIIYSDIGTSPLYVLNGIWPSNGPVPSQEDVIGGISCIIWALTIIPLMKYASTHDANRVFIALRFGTDEGEGGCFALYHGLIPPHSATAEEDRTLTGDSFRKASTIQEKQWLYKAKWILLPWALFGTSLTMADGVFTPAVSVTSAVGGIAVAVPSVSNHIIPISIGFLVFLFLIQRFGTAKLAFAFSPITFAWLALLAVTGIFNITKYPGIFRAFDPSRAVLLFVRTKDFNLLAGVLLAITGCEALFANLGQFNRLSIQLSFTCITYPALLLAYLGQGARLIVDGESVLNNVFYQTIPGPPNGPLFWIIYVFAILATLVASQALITATFSLLQQLMNMKSFLPLRMGLEDEFDGRNRVNLRHLIIPSDVTEKHRPEETTNLESEFEVEELEAAAATSMSLPISSSGKGLKMIDVDGRYSNELAVLPITAIFHKFAGGQGIPHSFVGFLRQYPALPRVVIFLSVRIVPTARVAPEERYVVNKVRSLNGFYGVTYQLGFKDDFDIRTDVVIEEICRLEAYAQNDNPAQYGEIIRDIKEAARKTTHIVPHYHVISKRVGFQGSILVWLNYPLNWARQVLIEVIYRRLITMFPETANWLTAADE